MWRECFSIFDHAAIIVNTKNEFYNVLLRQKGWVIESGPGRVDFVEGITNEYSSPIYLLYKVHVYVVC